MVIFNNMTSTILFLKSETNFYRFIHGIAKVSRTKFFFFFLVTVVVVGEDGNNDLWCQIQAFCSMPLKETFRITVLSTLYLCPSLIKYTHKIEGYRTICPKQNMNMSVVSYTIWCYVKQYLSYLQNLRTV